MKLDIIPDEDVIKSDSNITILNMARDQYRKFPLRLR